MASQDKKPKKQGTTDIDWANMFFPNPDVDVASPRISPLNPGIFGNARLANSSELNGLIIENGLDPKNFVRLLECYAVAHDPDGPKVVNMPGLPIPLGLKSPNALVIGGSGSGKTSKVILPSVYDLIKSQDNIFYINAKGFAQTRIVEAFAKDCNRASEFKVISPMSTKKGRITFGLKGSHRIQKASQNANILVKPEGADCWAEQQAEEFLAHAICAIWSDAPPPQKNLLALRNIILAGKYKAFSLAYPRFPVLSRFANYYNDGAHQNGATVANVISQKTSFVSYMADFLNGSNDLDPDTVVREGGIYVIEIDEKDVPITVTIVSLIINTLIAALQSKPVKKKWVIVIDELAVLHPDASFVQSLHTCRERGFSFIMGIQSISQLNAFGAKAMSILSGFQSKIILSSCDLETAEYFSRQSGTATIKIGKSILPRQLLLPGDISLPAKNTTLGSPATVFSSGFPPYQAYLTNFYDNGKFLKILDEAAQDTKDEILENEDQKSKPDGLEHTGLDEDCALTLDEAMELESLKKKIGWDTAKASTYKWVQSLQEANQDRPLILLQLCREILKRDANIQLFFEAYIHSNTENLLAILTYMDFTKMKNDAKKNKNKKQKEAEEEEEEDDIF